MQRKRAAIYRRVSGPIYGYQWVSVDRRRVGLEPDPETADVVRRIYRDVAAGITLLRIAVALTQESVPTAAKVWSVGTLRRVIANPIYKGEAPALSCPALVDATTWETAQRRMPVARG